MGKKRFKGVNKKLKINTTQKVKRGVVKVYNPANIQTYTNNINDIIRLVKTGRITLFKGKYSELQKFKNVAETYTEDVWQHFCESKQLSYIKNDYSVPQTLLTKKGNIPESYMKVLLDSYQDCFDIPDEFAFLPSQPDLIQKLIKMPKKAIAETHINAISDKHGRPCYIVRQLLESTDPSSGKKYLFINDIKFYQNSPTIASSLMLLRNGYKHSAFQIARVDEIGTISRDDYEYFKKTIEQQEVGTKVKVPVYPEYLLKKFGEHHGNTNNNSKQFRVQSEVSQERHMHVATEDYLLANALAAMCSHVYSMKPIDWYKKYNARGIELLEYFTNANNNERRRKKEYYGIEDYVRERKQEDNFIIDEIIKKDGILSTSRIIDFLNKTYNTTYVQDEKRNKKLTEIRKFKPTRTVEFVDRVAPFSPEALQIHINPKFNKLETKMLKVKGRYIDNEFLNAHPQYLRQQSSTSPNQPQLNEPPTVNTILNNKKSSTKK